MHWTIPEWSNIVWSDEEKFNLDGTGIFAYYGGDVRQGERVLSNRHSRRGGVRVWGAFSAEGCFEVAILQRRKDTEKYILTLHAYLIPFMREKNDNDLIFMLDSAAFRWWNGRFRLAVTLPKLKSYRKLMENFCKVRSCK